MKILNVKIKNYRQYRGENEISLSSNLEKNITIIQGNNGTGKSNFMNAITWCIYGDEMFKSKTNEGRSIVNESAVFEAAGEEVEVIVEVTIGNSSPEYKFRRSEVYYSKNNRPALAKPQEFSCWEISPTEGSKRLSQPQWIVDHKFISSKLRGFFFFDGEKMDDYFEDTSSIKTNVEKIAQIDTLDNAIRTLASVKQAIAKDMRTVSSEKTEELESSEDIVAEIEGYEKDKEDIENSIKSLEKEIKDIDEKLKANSSEVVKALTSNRDELSREKDACLTEIDTEKGEMIECVVNALPAVYANRALRNTAARIEEDTEKGELPPNIKDIFLKELLANKTCICGRPLDEGSDSRAHVEELLRRAVSNEIVNEVSQGKYIISELLKNANFTDEFFKHRKKQEKTQKKKKELDEKLDTISAQLAGIDQEEIRDLEMKRRDLDSQRSKLLIRKGTTGNKLANAYQKRDRYEEISEKYRKIDKRTEALGKQKDVVEKISGYMQDIRNSIVEDVRQQLETKTREYFFQMISKEKDSFSDVLIVDEGGRYRISVKSARGQECLGDISAGERQILALSFTAALYSVSGYSVPVFIDTPLARISEESRENVAKYLPEYLSDTQLVILPTDTEYTATVRNALLPRVGEEYRIEYSNADKVSKVVPYA